MQGCRSCGGLHRPLAVGVFFFVSLGRTEYSPRREPLSFPTCFCQKYLGILFLCKEMCQELRALLSPNGAKYESPGQDESRGKRLSPTPWVRERPNR
jgi:hypothetical protein